MLLSCSSSSSDGDGEVTISCSPTRIDVPSKGGTYKIMIVASEGGWEARASFPGEGPTANVYPWFKVSASGNNKAMGMVTVDVEENKSSVALDGGSELNSTDWRHEVKKSGWVNNELQNYVNGSADGKRITEIADNRLYINCFKGSNGKIYSGRVYAHETQGWLYGIFEARIKLPKGKGTWPAFWMMPCNNDFGANPWPKCGEIDIMEEVGVNPNYTSSSLHTEKFNHVMGTQITKERLTAGAEDGFHVYRLEWTPDYIKTYVDGKELLNFNNDGKNDVGSWPFNKPFYVILNLAWGGDWGGMKGVDESALPVQMEVDYVRVFQKK